MKELFNLRYLSSRYRRYHTFARFYAWHYILFVAVTALCMKLCPTNYIVKLMILLCGAGFAEGTVMFVRRQRNRNPVILIFTLALALLFLIYLGVTFYRALPADYGKIERGYVRYVATYRGVPYRKGGETRYGVDTVGMAKASLFRSGLEYGIKNHNMQIILRAAGFWWRCLNDEKLLREDGAFSRVVARYPGPPDPDKFIQGDMLYVEDSGVLAVYTGRAWFAALPGGSAGVIDIKKACKGSALVHIRWKVFNK
ncbi:MAG: hypothetical protein ILO36_00910 [Abditibacteriota bacterium]|nr:hypothetical protein [Abditibacteriota bacterium]